MDTNYSNSNLRQAAAYAAAFERWQRKDNERRAQLTEAERREETIRYLGNSWEREFRDNAA